MQYKNPANRTFVLEGLKIAGRMDLVGYGKKCLIRPEGNVEKQMPKGKSSGKNTIRNVHKKKETHKKNNRK